MPVLIRQTDFSDFESLRDIVQDRQSEVVQMDRGRMSGTMTHLSLGPDFGISTGTFARGIRTRGVLSPNRWTLGMMIDTKGPASANRQKMGAGDLAVFAPGVDRYGKYHDATRYFAAFVTPEVLQAFLVSQPGALDAIQHPHASVRTAATPATAQANSVQLRRLVDAFIEHGPQIPDDTAQFYQRSLLELLTAPVRDSVNYRGAKPLSADRLVREVDRYLFDAGSRPIHISELCEHFKVQRRTLHRAFHDVLGVPPITFLRQKRLGDVHTALVVSEDRNVRISDVAIAHGFIELSRFADAYRRFFGELPSATLRRAVRSATLATCLCSQLVLNSVGDLAVRVLQADI